MPAKFNVLQQDVVSQLQASVSAIPRNDDQNETLPSSAGGGLRLGEAP